MCIYIYNIYTHIYIQYIYLHVLDERIMVTICIDSLIGLFIHSSQTFFCYSIDKILFNCFPLSLCRDFVRGFSRIDWMEKTIPGLPSQVKTCITYNGTVHTIIIHI